MLMLLEIFWILDFIATLLGILLNVFLLFVIVKTSSNGMQKYSYSFLITSVIDIMIAVVEMATSHQIKIENGIIFVMPQGIERHLPNWISLFFGLHCFVGYNALFIIPAQYKYRYAFIREAKDDNSSIKVLFRDVSIAIICSIVLSSFMAGATIQGTQRSLNDYYLPMITGDDESLRPFVMYIFDSKDSCAVIATYLGTVIAISAIIITAYYIYKSYRFVHKTSDGVELSVATKSLQKQYTRNLISQTLFSVIFVIIPTAALYMALLFHLGNSFLGIGILLPFNSVSAINATLTMCLLKPYRRYVLSLLRCKAPENYTVATIPVKPMVSNFIKRT